MNFPGEVPPRKHRLMTPDELEQCVLAVEDDLLVLNKPGWIPCHPGKAGPWSCLAGACREHFGLKRAHLMARLDRETSGVVLMARHAEAASQWQPRVDRGWLRKRYVAILFGELDRVLTIDQSIAHDPASQVVAARRVCPPGEGAPARTHVFPLVAAQGFTLAGVVPETGRQHQIRVHLAWAGFPIVGDKIYGPDARLFLEFLETGWTPQLASRLLLERQALHAWKVGFAHVLPERWWEAPLPEDLVDFCGKRLGLDPRDFLKSGWSDPT